MSHQHKTTTRESAKEQNVPCVHCGDPCGPEGLKQAGKSFCCPGCLTVYALLNQQGLDTYYSLEDKPGLKPGGELHTKRFSYLDKTEIRSKLLDFDDGQTGRITLSIPQIHCSSCVWLLENLYRLSPAVHSSRVDFQRRQVSIAFEIEKLPLSELVGLLAALGYEPQINLSSAGKQVPDRSFRSLYARLAVCGFCLGNIMLLSFPEYLGLGSASDLLTDQVFDYLKLLLALPVVFYGAMDFFVPAYQGLRKRQVMMDVPISLGIATLFLRSIYDILVLNGAGYLDSLCALVFLLLVGRLFQKKVYFSITFDRDYRSYLPMAVIRKTSEGEESISLDEIAVSDRLLIRGQEIIPADSVLIEAEARIDYSFVTGESTPVRVRSGDRVFAGGRQSGATIEIEVIKEPSRSYLLRLWEETEAALREQPIVTALANRVSLYFTPAVLLVAIAAGAYWAFFDLFMAWNAATAVLIVACPCALALSSPFALGTAHRLLGKARFFLKDTGVVERLANLTAVVFDKTGTITHSKAGKPQFVGQALSNEEQAMVLSLVRQSIHPLSIQLSEILSGSKPLPISSFVEETGRGLQAKIGDHSVRVGSGEWVNHTTKEVGTSNQVFVSIDDRVLGYYRFPSRRRPGLRRLVDQLAKKYRLSLISGDHDGDRGWVAEIFGNDADLRFNQSPYDKLSYVTGLVNVGERVAMIGDGLNDAGALRAAGVGLTVVEDSSGFSPASDGVITARSLTCLSNALQFSRDTMFVVKASFVISFLYNFVGLAFAVQGSLSPIIAAVLMPISSVTVVLFASISTRYFAGLRGLAKKWK